jgi:hypothetical protein
VAVEQDHSFIQELLTAQAEAVAVELAVQIQHMVAQVVLEEMDQLIQVQVAVVLVVGLLILQEEMADRV